MSPSARLGFFPLRMGQGFPSRWASPLREGMALSGFIVPLLANLFTVGTGYGSPSAACRSFPEMEESVHKRHSVFQLPWFYAKNKVVHGFEVWVLEHIHSRLKIPAKNIKRTAENIHMISIRYENFSEKRFY